MSLTSAYDRGMPRLTPERRAMRRDQVLRAAVRCVIRSGFQGLTMSEVIAESGLSAGAVYGYFASKDALLAAVADQQLGGLDAVLDDFLRASTSGPPATPAEVLRALTEVVAAMKHTPDGDLSVAVVQVWGEAVLGGTVRDIMRPRLHEVESRLVLLAERWRAAGLTRPDSDPRHVARVVMALLPGYMLQQLVLDGLPSADFAAGLAALTQR